MSSSISRGAAPGAGFISGHSIDALTREAQTGGPDVASEFFASKGHIFNLPPSWWYGRDPTYE